VRTETRIRSIQKYALHRLHQELDEDNTNEELTDATRLHRFHSTLTRFNSLRLAPGYIHDDWIKDIQVEAEMRAREGAFIEQEREAVQEAAQQAPQHAKAFVQWFESLNTYGPGQGDPLFPWLASEASLQQMRWFLAQEAAGEAGFDDLVAMTQVKLPPRAKLEMARNYWDEMGCGNERAMHSLLLAAVVDELKLAPVAQHTAWQALALSNLMVGLATNRRYAYQAIGALGVIEMTAPSRVAHISEGLKRLQIPVHARRYFQIHTTLDVRHSIKWNDEILHTLVQANPRTAQPIAEGALMRLKAGARCFQCYREHFGLGNSSKH
jgi:hypothetical protein